MMKWFSKLDIEKDFSIQENILIRQKLLSDLYKHTETSLSTLLLVTLLYFYLLKGVVPDTLLYLWFIPTTLIIACRLYDAFRYPHRDSRKKYIWWYKNFIYKSFVTAFLWGMTSMIFFPYLHSSDLFYIQFILITGISSGAMTSISPDIRTASTYLFLMIAPLLVRFILQGNSESYLIALLLAIYFSLLVYVSRNIGSSLIRSYQEEEKSRQAQEKLYTKQEELNLIFKNTPVSIFYTDTEYKVIDFNLAYTKLFNSNREEILGMDLRQLPDQRPINALADGTMQYLGPYKSLKGNDLWIEAKAANLVNSKGDELGKLILIDDKTKEKHAIDELNYLVQHDEMTTLYNRRGFMQRLQALIMNERHQDHFSLFFYLDLNRFKTINDTMGHSIGDKLLIQVTKRLKTLSEDNTHIIGRLGGDEFGIILPFIAKEREKAIDQADSFAKAIQEAFVAPFSIEEMFLYVKSSTGIVIIEPSMHDTEEIIRYADIAMYDAKKRGKNTIAHYNAALDQERGELFALQHELYYALEKEQFEAYYQPIVRIKDDTSYTAEALVRWNHPQRGLLIPSEFIPLIIESGLIDKLGWMMIRTVCKQIAAWKNEKIFTLEYISINIDSVQFQNVHFTNKLLDTLKTYGVHPSEIRLEVTENTLIDNFEQARTTIDILKSKGILCAMDDFGTGYSSLSYLRKFSFSLLKIDKEFTQEITHKADTLTLVKSMIDVGKQLGYHIIIEGIETQEQRDLIRRIDSSIYYQGFLFSRPVPADTFSERFLEHRQESPIKEA